MSDNNLDQIKLLIKSIEMIEKAAKIIPVSILFFVILILFFDIRSFFEGNILAKIILSILVVFGLYLLLKIYQSRRRKRRFTTYKQRTDK